MSDRLEKNRLRVCYFGTFRADYSRNQIMIEGLRRNGVEVVECHESLWRGVADRVEVVSGGWLRLAFVLRVVRTYRKLLRAYRRIGTYDVMVLGYPGQLDVYLARVITWLCGKPLVLDVFMSLYLIASERRLIDHRSLTARLLRLLERSSCLLPDLLILDTAEYVEWFSQTYGVNPDRFRLVPTGADDRVFQPRDVKQGDTFEVIYYGTFIPNHGVEYIVEAARVLRDRPNIHFKLVGKGPTKAKAMMLARMGKLGNMTFVDWVEKDDLPRLVAGADVSLGVFGTTPQSRMTVQNKIYESLAMRKPVITGDSPTVRATLCHGEHVYLVRRADGEALARAILALYDDPALREKLARQGYDYWQERFTVERIGQQFREHLAQIV